ncbi:MAG: glycine--tRNA ligase [Prosthecobacter sp.]|uniref:glycine--tRNA ligase n=1 Tax=Prosthecobacter sp. TaxID=1965333 RepID=UPI003900B1B2
MSSDPKASQAQMEKIVSLCKRRGFIYQSSEIYGGINGFWDYGPLGAELKRNLRTAWWNTMMRDREDVVGLDASIIMHPAIWKASGHVDTFSDPMSTCKSCKKLVRSDQVWSMLAEQRWVQSLAEVADVPTQSFDGPALLRWAERKGKDLAPNLALVRNPQVTLSWLAERSAGSKDNPLSAQEFYQYIATEQKAATGLITPCPHCGGELTEPRPFNLMFDSHAGPVKSDDNIVYLRPETAQAIFVQFKNVFDSSRVKVPFGIGQIGKAFRNEITPRNYTFRSREFEQMELEFFIRPDEVIRLIYGEVAQWHEGADLAEPQPNWGWELWHRYWVDQRTKFYAAIGLGKDVLDYYWQSKDELAHYATATVDILFKFPFGTEELEGIAARGDFDLTQHQKHSGKSLEVFDEELREAVKQLTDEQKKTFIAEVQEEWNDRNKSREDAAIFCDKLLSKASYLPHVIEPSAGLDRLALAILTNAFCEEEKADVNGKVETRTFLRFHPRVAPIKVGVFPLLKNKPELVAKAREVYDMLKKHLNCFYDESAAIGRRYARQDEVGTPFGVTIDFDSLGEKGPELLDTVTLRHRDSNEQERVKISELLGKLLPLVS